MPEPASARVAVVDDNPATLYSTARVLRAAGFEVRQGNNGQSALDLAFQGIDLLLLDVNLPDLHGFEVCRRLREDQRTRRLPIIHLSATFVRDIDKAEGLDSGGDGYLTHPVEPPVLIATVNAFLRARRAEDEMRKSDAKFRAVFDGTPNGILLLDESLNCLELNPAASQMLGRPRDQVINNSLSSFLPAAAAAMLPDVGRELKDTGAWRGVLPLWRPDGVPLQLEFHISAHSFPGVQLAILTDITERMKLEAERNELLASERTARAEAERASYLKDEFLGTLSHELRAPLNSILLWAQRLQNHPHDFEQVERGLAAIVRNTRTQAQLISDLLDVSAIVSGKLRLNVEPIDLAGTIKSSLEGLSPGIEAKGLELTSSFDQNVGFISGDPARLQQVVWNLVNNAIKFTPSGGQIEVDLRRSDSQVQIIVTDNGQGITRDLLPHLFERFRQGNANTARAHGGLGLGLAIVKHLVEMHGGTVRAESPGEGLGASFVVTLPVAPAFNEGAATPAESASRSGDMARLEGARVLIVDDDQDTCAVLSRILSETGAAVAAAYDVDSALERTEEFKPQVLVSDIGMPERDGYELIREVRARLLISATARHRTDGPGPSGGPAAGPDGGLPDAYDQAGGCRRVNRRHCDADRTHRISRTELNRLSLSNPQYSRSSAPFAVMEFAAAGSSRRRP